MYPATSLPGEQAEPLACSPEGGDPSLLENQEAMSGGEELELLEWAKIIEERLFQQMKTHVILAMMQGM